MKINLLLQFLWCMLPESMHPALTHVPIPFLKEVEKICHSAIKYKVSGGKWQV